MAISISRQRKVRRWHRGIAMLTSVQLLLWTISGIYFAFVDIDYVRGGQFRVEADLVQIDLARIDHEYPAARKLTILERLPGEIIVGVHSDVEVLWRGENGAPLEALNEQQALMLGMNRTSFSPDAAEWVDNDVPGSEYRGAPLPLWRLWDSNAPDRVAYMNAMSGEILAVRHEAWRWWDLLWSLHIMSYSDRDTIGNWLLKTFSLLAFLTAVLGLWLYRETRRNATF